MDYLHLKNELSTHIKQHRIFVCACLCFIVWFIALLFFARPTDDTHMAKEVDIVHAVKAAVPLIEQHTHPGARLAVIQNHLITRGVLQYYLTDRHFKRACPVKSTKVILDRACRLSPNKFIASVKKYDYLLVINGSKTFWHTYAGCFVNAKRAQHKRLFKLNRYDKLIAVA